MGVWIILYYIHYVRCHMSISIYICYIVTKPGNLIRLFVNELVAPTCVQDTHQCGVCVWVCVCVLEQCYYDHH